MTLIKSISGIRGTIGGRADEGLTPLDVVKLTSAYAALIRKTTTKTTNKIVVGRDARLSGDMVNKIVCGTLMGMGFDVVDIGLASTPTTEVAVTMEEACGGIILTASHNPRQWNALKLLNEKGEFLNAAEGQEVLRIAAAEEFDYADVETLGKYRLDETYNEKHIDAVLALPLVDVEAIKAANFKVAIDCVNSVGGVILPQLFEKLGNTSVSVEECHEALVLQAQWIRLTFAQGSGKRKTQLQKDIELLEELLNKKAEYFSHLGKLGSRNSYSKTDIDATFMHMKEDYMRNGQLKPGYNIQIGVESEYIVGIGAFSNRSDVNTLIPFLNRIKSHTRRLFERIIADAGYESSENYLYLEENGQECFIKPTNYEISKKKTYKTNPYSVENMAYNAAKDEYTCPDGRKLKFKRERTTTTENGYTVSTRYYSNDKCGRCPHREKCHSSKAGYRTVRVNQILNEYRPKVLEALTSEEGALLRMNRSIQVEGVFGVLKEDYGFRRFLTRGKKNVETQFFLLAFALNIEKLCNREKKGRIGLDLFTLNAS